MEEQKLPVVGVNFGSKAQDGDRFYNLKSEIYWNLRNDFEQNTIDIPQHDRLLDELPSLMYEVTSRGLLKIVSKEAMKKLGLRSPDYADALVIAHYGTYSSQKGIIDFYKEKYEQRKEPVSLLNQAIRSGNIEPVGT